MSEQKYAMTNIYNMCFIKKFQKNYKFSEMIGMKL